MKWFDHSFEAPLERHGVGKTRKVWYRVLYLPTTLAAKLPFDRHPRLRIEGEIADVPVASAFMPTGEGRYYVIVSPATVRAAGLKLGDLVEMRFRVADQAAVALPDALQKAIDGNARAKAAWERLTPGRRRALSHHVASAKTDATRARRIAAVLAAVGGRRNGADAADVARLEFVLGRRTRRDPASSRR